MKDIIMVLILLVCAWTDYRYRKIYNIIIGPGLLLAIFSNLILAGLQGVGQSLLGFAAGIGLLSISFIMGGMGAGDVKLLALVGAFKGPLFVFYAFLATAVIGGLMAIIILILKKDIIKVGKNIFAAFFCFFFSRFRLKTYVPETVTKLPYGIAIALGTFAAYWVR